MEKTSPDIPLLDVRELRIGTSLNRNGLIPVQGISFSVNPGEVVGFVGESGSGKTLTALSIIHLLPAGFNILSGHIFWQEPGLAPLDLADKNLCGWKKLRGSRIGMVFQEPMTALNPSLKCGSQVAEVLRVHTRCHRKEAVAKSLNLLAETGLKEPARIAGSFPFQLSGGQRQRVMIAMAIACRPALLIADEPTTALDLHLQLSILELLRDLCKQYTMGLIFITHDLRLVSEIASRVLVMHNGMIEEQGNTQAVLFHPSTAYTRSLMGSLPPLTGRPHRLGIDNPPEPSVKIKTDSVSQPATAKEPILQIRNLEVWYSPVSQAGIKCRHQALKPVNFDVYAGETFGIIGESGSGKTTLARGILHLLDSCSGQVLYHGLSLNNLNNKKLRKMRKKIQVVFQDPYSSLNPKMQISEILEEPLRVHEPSLSSSARRKLALQMLSNVRLPEDSIFKYPHEFSGGQRQRIAIARALILKPEVVICDECVSALDVSVQARILNLLNDLKETFGLTYLFISHDLTVIHYMAQRMLVLRDGSIVEQGDTDQLWQQPSSSYLKELLHCLPGKKLTQDSPLQ